MHCARLGRPITDRRTQRSGLRSYCGLGVLVGAIKQNVDQAALDWHSAVHERVDEHFVVSLEYDMRRLTSHQLLCDHFRRWRALDRQLHLNLWKQIMNAVAQYCPIAQRAHVSQHRQPSLKQDGAGESVETPV